MLSKYLKLTQRFMAVSLANASAFRLDFFTSIFHYLVYQTIFILFWKSILQFTAGHLGEWQFQDLALISAFLLASTAINQWFMGFRKLPQKVLRGDLDKYLCRPVHPLFTLLAEEINIVSCIQQAVSSLLILVAICIGYHIVPTLWDLVSALAILLVGTMSLTLIQGCIGLSAFWLGNVSHVHRLFGISKGFERYPVNLLPMWLAHTLTWVFPVGLISVYPTLTFVGKAEPGFFLLGGLGVVLLWGLCFGWIWSRALRRYESFGG